MRVDLCVPTLDNTVFDDEFLASSGTDEHPMLDDSPHDGDTSYVYSSTPGHSVGVRGYHDSILHSPSAIYAVKGNIICKNAGDGVAVVRADLGYNTTRETTTNNYTYSLPAGGSYEGMHTIMAGDSATDGTYQGSYNASTTPWTTGLVTGGLYLATVILEYVS
jgi:hypothetical protein